MATKHLESQTHHLGVTIPEDPPSKDTIIGCISVRSLQYLFFGFSRIAFYITVAGTRLKSTTDISDLCIDFPQDIRLAGGLKHLIMHHRFP